MSGSTLQYCIFCVVIHHRYDLARHLLGAFKLAVTINAPKRITIVVDLLRSFLMQ